VPKFAAGLYPEGWRRIFAFFASDVAVIASTDKKPGLAGRLIVRPSGTEPLIR
jgi:phosphomannomutase